MVFLVKPSEIGLLLQRASQGTFSTGLAHGSQGVCPTSVDTPPLLKRSDFVAAGATLVPEEDHPTPAFDFIFGWIWLLALIAHCVTGLFLGGVYFGPPIVNFARRLLRAIIRRLRAYFGL